MDTTIFNKIATLKHNTIRDFRKKVTNKSISYLKDQEKSNDQEHNQQLNKKIKELEKSLENNEDTIYPVDTFVEKHCYFSHFSILLNDYEDELLNSLSYTMKIYIDIDTIKNILSEKKALWYQPIDCFIYDLKWLGSLLKVPIAFLVKNLDFPDDFELIDENGDVINLNNLIISDIVIL